MLGLDTLWSDFETFWIDYRKSSPPGSQPNLEWEGDHNIMDRMTRLATCPMVMMALTIHLPDTGGVVDVALGQVALRCTILALAIGQET
jgi:hypothetical protein